MSDKKVFGVIVIIIIALLIANSPTINFLHAPKGLFAIFGSSPEDQFKQEYTTIWSDNTNGQFSAASNCKSVDSGVYEQEVVKAQQAGTTNGCITNGLSKSYFENDKFAISTVGGNVYTTSGGGAGFNDAISIVSPSSQVTIKQKFKGQEIAVIFGGNTKLNGKYGSNGAYTSYVLKPHTLEPTKWDVIHLGQGEPFGKVDEITANTVDNFLQLSFSGDGWIEYIGYKAQFECDLSPNERWIETQWINSVNIDDIIKKDGLLPTKFCKTTRPFVLRDIQQGETAIYPDPIPDFNRGATITSPTQNQLITVRYAIYQVKGLDNPTDNTQAYRCIQRDSNYKCTQWNLETVIKPVEVVVQCNADTDCPQPLKTLCPNYFVGCQNKKCIYDDAVLNAPICKNEVVTIVKQIQEVEKRTVIQPSGSNTFTFSQNSDRPSFSIGDSSFTATQPQYSCAFPSSDFLSPPNPSSDCWKSKITYEGKGFDIKDSQIQALNSLISVQYFAGGKLTNVDGTWKYNKPQDWGNSFIFNVDTANAFQIQGTYGNVVLQNSDLHLKFNIINNLPKGNALIKVRQKARAINLNLPEQSISTMLNNGNNAIDIKLDSKNLNLNDVYVDVFYKIQADTLNLLPAGSMSLTYNIATELPSVTSVVYINSTQYINNTQYVHTTTPTPSSKVPIYIGLGILAFFIISRL